MATTGQIVQHNALKGYGLVTVDAGATLMVQWSDKSESAPIDKNSVSVTLPTMWYQQLRSFALEKVGMSETDLRVLHKATANLRDDMSFPVLAELEQRLKANAVKQIEAMIDGPPARIPDDQYEATWNTIEQTAAEVTAQVTAEDDDDFFAAYAEEEDDPKPEPAGNAESEASTIPGATAATSVVELAGSKLCALCLRVAVNKSSKEIEGERVCSKCFKSWTGGSDPKQLATSASIQDSAPSTGGGADPKSPGTAAEQTVVDQTCSPNASETTATDAVTASESDTTTPEDTTASEPIRTEAGLIDPETGMLIEPSLIMRRFGWTEMPFLPPPPGPKPEKLPKKASPEQIELHEQEMRVWMDWEKKRFKFEEQLDQVLDLTLSYEERTTRWRASTELRCQPLDRAGEYYTETFIAPMARELAKYNLPRYKSGDKKGEYSKKTMPLFSGAIKFTAAGGYFVHDAEEVKKEIEKQGVAKYAALIDAKLVVKYNHDKLMTALKNGAVTISDLPGTGHKPKDDLAKVKAISPASKEKEDDESE